MTRPYKHPKTGVYWVRKVVPAALRVLVWKTELKASLGTHDPREAKIKAGPVIAQFETTIAMARTGGRTLSEKDIAASVANCIAMNVRHSVTTRRA